MNCLCNVGKVAPFAGAWIEMLWDADLLYTGAVAPFAGAWIEILSWGTILSRLQVAPFAGAWIEITLRYIIHAKEKRRSLRGSVD